MDALWRAAASLDERQPWNRETHAIHAAAWAEAAATAQSQVGVEVVSYTVGPNDGDFATAYGVGPSGAALVRPDGYVAWRAPAHTADAADRVTAVLRQVLALT